MLLRFGQTLTNQPILFATLVYPMAHVALPDQSCLVRRARQILGDTEHVYDTYSSEQLLFIKLFQVHGSSKIEVESLPQYPLRSSCPLLGPSGQSMSLAVQLVF